MSAEEMRRLTVAELTENLRVGEKKMRDLRYDRPAVYVPKNGQAVVAPGSTVEMVGVLHIEINAELRAIERAIEIVNETYRVLTSPKPAADEDVEEKREDIY